MAPHISMLKFIEIFRKFQSTNTYFLNELVPLICFLFGLNKYKKLDKSE